MAAVVAWQHVGAGVLHKAVPALDHRRFVRRHQANRFHQVHHQHHLLPARQVKCQRVVGQILNRASVWWGRGRRHTLEG